MGKAYEEIESTSYDETTEMEEKIQNKKLEILEKEEENRMEYKKRMARWDYYNRPDEASIGKYKLTTIK